jgi:MYXO-CTERM domain-containing protein
LVKWAACGTVGLGLTHETSEATLVTFGGFPANNLSIASLPDYGDNVAANSADYTVSPGIANVIGTPDITLDWFSQWDTYTDWHGRGNVAQSDFNGGITASILFTPSPTSAVRLVSFELDEWVAGGAGSIAWDVTDSSGIRTSGTWTMTDAGGRSVVAPNIVGVLGDPLTLNLTLISGAPSYYALDNLTFDQVPEPSTLTLALPAAALGAAAMRRRRSA